MYELKIAVNDRLEFKNFINQELPLLVCLTVYIMYIVVYYCFQVVFYFHDRKYNIGATLKEDRVEENTTSLGSLE